MKRKSTAPARRTDSAATPSPGPGRAVPPGRAGPEELQRINEELATSQEELKSANEELRAFNEEVTTRNAELHVLNADLHNLQLNASIALVVLDRAGTVRSFTPLAKPPFNLRATDVGRPLNDIRHHLHARAEGEGAADATGGGEARPLDLENIARDVIAHATPRTLEVQDGSGHWFSLSVRPYLTLEQKVDGAVLVLADIDAVKRSERAASAAREYAEATLRTARDPLLVLRADLCVNSASEAYYKLFRTTPAATEGRSFWKLDDGRWKSPRLLEQLHGVLPRHSFFDGLEIVCTLPDLGLRTLLLNARPLDSATGAAEMILLGIEDVTERLRLDDAVRLSEERFRALAQASTQIIWTAKADGRFAADSLPWRAITGQSYEQWRDRGWLDAVHPEDRAAAGQRWEACVARESLYETQFRLRRADGVYRWTAVRAVPVFARNAKIREWIGTNTDITESRRVGALQAAQKEAFELTLKGAPIDAVLDVLVRTAQEQSADGGRTAIFVVDPGGECLRFGATAGLAREFSQGLDGLRIGPGSPSCGTAAYTGDNVIVADVALDPMWAPYHALARAHDIRACWSVPIRSMASKVLGTFVIYHAVPRKPLPGDLEALTHYASAAGILLERHLSAAALQASEERYRTLFNSIDEGFCVVELRVDDAGRPADFRYLEVNPAFEKQSGLRDPTGKWISELVPDLEPHWLEAFGQVALTGEAARFERRFQAFNRWLDVYAFRLGGPDSRVVAVLFCDTTARRHKAQELQRTHEKAVETSRAKDDFLATLSHELRTPLSPVLLLASEAADDPSLPERVRADFATISTGVALEARLIDDLLDLTRVTRGKLRLDLHTCNVEVVLRDALTVVAAEVQAKHIQLVLNLQATRTDVMGDPIRLQQVFWNVLRNAVHFTPDHGRIEVASRTETDDGALTIAITDTGSGIAADELERIFDAFTQGGEVPGAAHRVGGLGLGLAISRALVELHAGSIHATSPGRGRGATFIVRIPLLAPDTPPDTLTPAPTTAAETSAHPAEPTGAVAAPQQRVLVVDDHAPTRVALRRLLERRNCVVFTAASIAEARTLGQQQAIDVLISDIGLPDGDGRVLMHELRGRCPALQGIALSGYGMETDLAKSRLAGFADHLTKPVTVSMVDRALVRMRSVAPSSNGVTGRTESQS